MWGRCVAAVTGALVCGTFTASPVHADEYDFISVLDGSGVYYESILDMIDAGKLACHGMRAHMYGPVVAGQLDNFGSWTPHEKNIIMSAAANTMCPDVWPWIKSLSTPAAPSPSVPGEQHPCTTANPPAGCADGSY